MMYSVRRKVSICIVGTVAIFSRIDVYSYYYQHDLCGRLLSRSSFALPNNNYHFMKGQKNNAINQLYVTPRSKIKEINDNDDDDNDDFARKSTKKASSKKEKVTNKKISESKPKRSSKVKSSSSDTAASRLKRTSAALESVDSDIKMGSLDDMKILSTLPSTDVMRDHNNTIQTTTSNNQLPVNNNTEEGKTKKEKIATLTDLIDEIDRQLVVNQPAVQKSYAIALEKSIHDAQLINDAMTLNNPNPSKNSISSSSQLDDDDDNTDNNNNNNNNNVEQSNSISDTTSTSKTMKKKKMATLTELIDEIDRQLLAKQDDMRKSTADALEKSIASMKALSQPNDSSNTNDVHLTSIQDDYDHDLDSNSNKLTKKKSIIGTYKSKYPSGHVVSRIKEAAVRESAAAAAAAAALRNRKDTISDSIVNNNNRIHTTNINNENTSTRKMATLSELTDAIDKQLLVSNNNLLMQTTMNNAGTRILQQHPARDSMTAVIMHNDRTSKLRQRKDDDDVINQQLLRHMMINSPPKKESCTITKNVAIVFAKPLINDQISVETVARIRRLVKSLVTSHDDEEENQEEEDVSEEESKDDDEDQVVVPTTDDEIMQQQKQTQQNFYYPDIICFVGGKFGNNALNDCDVCYMYFKNIYALTCMSLHIKPNNFEFHLIPSYVQDGAIDDLCNYIKEKYIPQWLNEFSQQGENESQQTINTNPIRHSRIPNMNIHFTLVSSDYHLCIVNDIHVRSPNQSPIRALESFTFNNNKRNERYDAKIETSWSYQYATTMNLLSQNNNNDKMIYNSNPLYILTSKCYRMGQELIPVIQNLRGVVNNIEFFQQDNYRVLVSVRRTLVNAMEELYSRQPSLHSLQGVFVRQQPIASTSSLLSNNNTEPVSYQKQSHNNNEANSYNNNDNNNNRKQNLDVVLESALISMGRCLDLVRPAGLLTGSVPINDFKIALRILEQAVQQITTACDPDHPLHPSDWSTL